MRGVLFSANGLILIFNTLLKFGTNLVPKDFPSTVPHVIYSEEGSNAEMSVNLGGENYCRLYRESVKLIYINSHDECFVCVNICQKQKKKPF